MLIQNLKDEHIQESIALLSNDDRAILDEFVRSNELPDKVDGNFVNILSQVLAGLIKVTISLEEIRAEIRKAGGSLTPDELKRILDNYVDSLTQGKDPKRVRIVLE
jgi:hypothetical protein